jgi:hypothetical protein
MAAEREALPVALERRAAVVAAAVPIALGVSLASAPASK